MRKDCKNERGVGNSQNFIRATIERSLQFTLEAYALFKKIKLDKE